MAGPLSRRSFLRGIPALAAVASVGGLGGLLSACGDATPPNDLTEERRRAYTRRATVRLDDDEEYVPADTTLTPIDADNGDVALPNVVWQARAKQLEDEQVRLHGGVFTTNVSRNGVMSGKEASHVPRAEIASDSFGSRSVVVVVEHVMAAPRPAADGGAAAPDGGDAGVSSTAVAPPDHYVSTVYLRADVDGQSTVVGLWELAPDDAAPPTMRFALPTAATNVVAYAFCTLHGLWRSEPIATR